MDETSEKPVMVRQFQRRHFVRIVIGGVLAVAAYGVVNVYATYQREQRIALEIEAFGGTVVFQYAGPDWIPLSVRDRVPLFNRVTVLDLQYKQFTVAALEHLKGLSNVESISLANTHVTDASVEHLKRLTNLGRLYLDNSKVTDEECRAMLRKKLPIRWIILPDPDTPDGMD